MLNLRTTACAAIGCLSIASTAFAQGSTCAAATPVENGAIYSGPAFDTTLGATYTNAGITCGTSNGNRAQWFRYTAAGNGQVVFDTCETANATSDTVLSIHSDCTTNAANVLACNDDLCGNNGYKSRITQTVVAGTTYFIRVSNFGAGGPTAGPYTFSVGPLTTPPPPTAGPDVATWRVDPALRYPDVEAVAAFAIGATATNYGDMNVDWRDGDNTSARNTSPLIAQNLYKLKNGRFTQLGQSWLKHGWASSNSNGGPGPCQPTPLGGSQLGINCLDTYGAGSNGTQNYLGPRSQVNGSTGYFAPVVNNTYSTGDSISKRLQVPAAELETSNGSTVRYFSEASYTNYDDATWGNALNNATCTESTLAGPTATPAHIGTMYRGDPAILAWGRTDSSVVTVNADHHLTLIAYGSQGDSYTAFPTLPRDITCRYIVAAKVTQVSASQWHYEYCIYNHNSDRSAYALSLRLPAGAATSNEGVTFPRSHSGEPYTNGGWLVDKSVPGVLTFKADASYAANPNANAIRWGTMYTLWFDANVPPATGQAKIQLFKPPYSGSHPSTLAPAGRVVEDLAVFAYGNGLPTPRACVADVATLGGSVGPDGRLTADDLIVCLESLFAGNLAADLTGLGGDGYPDGRLTPDDLVYFLGAFFGRTGCE